MSQRTLHYYNYPIRTTSSRRVDTATPTPPFPFLNLPISIRRRIYILAGLFSGFKIHLNYEPPNEDQGIWDETYDPFCTQFLSCSNLEEIPQQEEIDSWSEQISHFIEGPLRYPKIMLDRDIYLPGTQNLRFEDGSSHDIKFAALPIQLLYVSQQVSMEVKKIFWSENYFSISQPDIGRLSFLESISPTSLRFMTSLSIRLNYWGDKWAINANPTGGTERADCHVGCPTYGFHAKIAIPSTKQEKALMKTWYRVCDRLSKFVTPGKLQLWIFCDVVDEEAAKLILEPLSQLPVLRDCGIRLSYDPEDLELKSLARSTALRLRSPKPINDSTFSFGDLPLELKTKILEYTSLVAPTELIWNANTGGNGPLFYQKKTDLAEEHIMECCDPCHNEEEICYCHTLHSAYSSTCTCWCFPSEFFFVSRDFRMLALSIFYSKNKFYLVRSMFDGDDLYPGTTGLLTFLSGIPHDARSDLRYITLITDSNQGRQESWEWTDAIDFCADQFDLSKLTIVIDMSGSDKAYHAATVSPVGSFRDALRRKFQRVQWESVLPMAKSIGRYKGWKDVFFHLSHQGEDKFPGNRKRMESLLEKVANGRNYDSLSRGKVYRECECKVVWPDESLDLVTGFWEDVGLAY